MAWGTKFVRFSTGDKVKVANAVLEAVKTAIIREYKITTARFNDECCEDDKIRIFSNSTYLKWLRVNE